jgi:hypothetical protein
MREPMVSPSSNKVCFFGLPSGGIVRTKVLLPTIFPTLFSGRTDSDDEMK